MKQYNRPYDIVVKSEGRPTIPDSEIPNFFDRIMDFYSEPENEKAFQRWREERQKRKAAV